MALIVILLSVVLSILALAVGFVFSKSNRSINDLCTKIRLTTSKQTTIGAGILIASSLLSALYSITYLFTQYSADWVSNSTSLMSAVSQAFSITILVLSVVLGIALLQKSATLLFISPSLILVLTVIKSVFIDKGTLAKIYREYFVFLPMVAVMLSLLMLVSALGGTDKAFFKFKKIINMTPWLLLLTILNNGLNIISARTFHISTAISCICVVLNVIAYIFIFKAFTATVESTSSGINKSAVPSKKEKLIIVLSALLLPLIVNIVSGKALLRYTIIIVAVCLVAVFKLTENEKTHVRKKALICAAVIVGILCAVSMVLPSPDTQVSCGHPDCEVNGPFPCMGKNNTCPNYTYCYKDIYCDECE